MATNSEQQLDSTPCSPLGTLIVIGGHERKEGGNPIMRSIADRARSGKLVIATLASDEPDEQWTEYRQVFRECGVQNIEQFDTRTREEALRVTPDFFDQNTTVFFAGGNQLKITRSFGGTALCDRLREIYRQGATIAGTSSGASVMTEVMMAGGQSNSSHEEGDSLQLAPGLGFISGVIIDQHFAERGRIGRLLGAVAENPRLLGIGIDEDTALVIKGHHEAEVIGSGAVYVVDGREITGNRKEEGVMSAFGVRLHVLSSGDRINLATRTPEHGC
ncbi:MAG TPA: cyanophycinase [Bryobacteraceae bacterium]|jgi:cyanophycinase|nr:cyanophycinase [Bryobacteraceae bacterium]